MPVAEINKKQKLVDDFQKMMQETLQINEYDRFVIIDKKSTDFFQPTNTDRDHAFFEIQLFIGRSLNVKDDFFNKLPNCWQTLTSPKENTRIVLQEIERDNWGIRGGQVASGIILGYPVEE